jgi:uncharacterized membrane protein (DUF106 family)
MFMYALNSVITSLFDILFRPFGGLSPLWGLLAISVITGIVMVIIFKFTSNQGAIRRTKDKISAYFLEVRLYKDDLSLMLDAQRRILRTNLTYMKYSLMPMLVMIVPVVLILIQLGIRYENRPLKPGDSALVKLKFEEPVDSVDIAVAVDDGIRLETPLLRIPEEREIDFRIGAVEAGDHHLTIRLGENAIATPVIVANRVTRVYPERTKAAFSGALFAPGQKPLPADSPLQSVSILLPKRQLKLLGVSVHWLVFFFVVSIIAGYSLKGVFKVEV